MRKAKPLSLYHWMMSGRASAVVRVVAESCISTMHWVCSPGLPHDVAEDGACTGLAAHSVLGADVPVYIDVAFCSDFFFELLHQPAPAVAAAHSVGTAAWEAQIPQAVGRT